MTLNINTMLGRNKVNRIAHSTANFYPGTAQADYSIDLAAGYIDQQTLLPVPSTYSAALTSPSKVLQVVCTRPVTVLITVNTEVSTLIVNKLLIVDSPVSAIEIQNFDMVNPVQAIITYLT
jgi:hypothetical protein